MRPRENPQARRRAIIQEAIGAIGERGYFGFTIQDLARRCGLTNGGLLYHFQTKEQLFLAVVDEYEQRVGSAAMTVVGNFVRDYAVDGRLSLQAAKALLRALMVQSIAEPEMERLFLSLQAEALIPSHPGYDRFRRMEERIVEGFARIIADHCVDPLSTARLIYAVMHGLEHQWFRSDSGFDILAEWEKALGLALPDKVSVAAE